MDNESNFQFVCSPKDVYGVKEWKTEVARSGRTIPSSFPVPPSNPGCPLRRSMPKGYDQDYDGLHTLRGSIMTDEHKKLLIQTTEPLLDFVTARYVLIQAWTRCGYSVDEILNVFDADPRDGRIRRTFTDETDSIPLQHLSVGQLYGSLCGDPLLLTFYRHW